MVGVDSSILIAYELAEHAEHSTVKTLLDEVMQRGEKLALCESCIAEFVHIATDPRRFEHPLGMQHALERAAWWIEAVETEWLAADDETVLSALNWMNQHHLGRKRVVDTFTAATFANAGVTLIATLNPGDFRVFDLFDFLPRTDA